MFPTLKILMVNEKMNVSRFECFGDHQALAEQWDRDGNTKRTELCKESLLGCMIETLKVVKQQPWVPPLLELVNCPYVKAKGDFVMKDYAL
jgi:hypothetical protein